MVGDGGDYLRHDFCERASKRRFGWTHHRASFVDPHPCRDIDYAQQPVQGMLLVDQCWMFWIGGLEKWTGGLPATGVHSHRDDLKPSSMEFLSPLPPHGQVKPAAS